jgi:acyl dehydratase
MFDKGDKYQHSFKVTSEIFDGFTTLFDDKNPLHTDEPYAVNKGFRAKVVHGNVLNGFLSHFVGECIPVKNVLIISQTIFYRKPVYVNDKLTLYTEVNDFHESVKTVEFLFKFINQDETIVSTGKISICLI